MQDQPSLIMEDSNSQGASSGQAQAAVAPQTTTVETRDSGTNAYGGYGPRGQIEVIMGPMFSGKSTELLRRLQRQRIAKKNVLLIKHSSDQRYQGSDRCVVTHDQMKNEAQLIISELDSTLFQ